MPTLTSTYLLPAILLNPAFILHLINTFVSHLMPPPPTVSHSPHQFMESLGPLPGSKPYLDMHADVQLCWRYTAVMVVVQILAIGRVQDNRVARRTAKAAKLEREKLKKEKLEKLAESWKAGQSNGHIHTVDGTSEVHEVSNGMTKVSEDVVDMRDDGDQKTGSETEESLTETSEEEMIV